jgi:hypothetical protein
VILVAVDEIALQLLESVAAETLRILTILLSTVEQSNVDYSLSDNPNEHVQRGTVPSQKRRTFLRGEPLLSMHKSPLRPTKTTMFTKQS